MWGWQRAASDHGEQLNVQWLHWQDVAATDSVVRLLVEVVEQLVDSAVHIDVRQNPIGPLGLARCEAGWRGC